jgi:hypothetical protein
VALADPVLTAAPVPPPAAPVLPADPVLPAAPVLPADPVLPDPALPDPVLPDPVLAAGAVLSGGLVPASPEAAAGDTGAEELPLAGVDTIARGPAVFDGWAEPVEQGLPVAPAVCLAPVALVLAFADAVVLAPPVAVEVALADSVAVALTVPVGVVVAVALSVGPLLVLPVGGLLAGLAAGALGVAELADLADLAWVDDVDDGEPVWQTVAGAPFWPAAVPAWLTPPADVAFWVADPFRLGVPVPVLELEIPTAEPSWTKASRSGGTARATPMANTTQAAARAGRSSPNPQSRCCRPPAPAASLPPAPAASCPPRAAFQRRTMSARKPPLTAECLLAWADPELTRARIRSSPSGRGSS